MSMQELIELRHILHAHPELSGQEALTNGILNQWVKQTLPDQLIEKIGGFGLAAIYKGAKPGKRILIRGDIDVPFALFPRTVLRFLSFCCRCVSYTAR